VQSRDTKGLWQTKGDGVRRVRSLRLTDAAWEALNKKAAEQSLSTADLIEQVAIQTLQSPDHDKALKEAIALLQECFTIPSNKAGGIKRRIEQVLKLLG
jgi:hypothetical protein